MNRKLLSRLAEAGSMVLLAAFLISGARALRVQEDLASRVVRLHVTANSDAAHDQALKLRVRDAVLRQAEEILSGAEDAGRARSLLEEALPALEAGALRTVRAAGYGYAVSVRLCREEFPTRHYGTVTLPAGEYEALRVRLGTGRGRNWWCVVFPPLCSAAGAEEAVLTSGFTPEEVELLTEEGYTLKLKSVELWEELRRTLRDRGLPLSE